MTIIYNVIESNGTEDDDRNSICVFEAVNNRDTADRYAQKCNRRQGADPKYRYTVTVTKIDSGR